MGYSPSRRGGEGAQKRLTEKYRGPTVGPFALCPLLCDSDLPVQSGVNAVLAGPGVPGLSGFIYEHIAAT